MALARRGHGDEIRILEGRDATSRPERRRTGYAAGVLTSASDPARKPAAGFCVSCPAGDARHVQSEGGLVGLPTDESTRMKRGTRSSVIFLVVAGLFFAAGGGDAVRRGRARWRAWLQPPTTEQIQRVVPDTGAPPRATLTREAVHGKMWLADPPRPASVVVVLVSIIAATLAAMYFTGRSGSSAESR